MTQTIVSPKSSITNNYVDRIYIGASPKLIKMNTNNIFNQNKMLFVSNLEHNRGGVKIKRNFLINREKIRDEYNTLISHENLPKNMSIRENSDPLKIKKEGHILRSSKNLKSDKSFGLQNVESIPAAL